MDTLKIDSLQADTGIIEALLDTSMAEVDSVAHGASDGVISYLFAGVSPGYFWAAVITALIGIAIRKLIHLSKRDKSSKRTPEKFNFQFWIHDRPGLYLSHTHQRYAYLRSFETSWENIRDG